MVEGDQRANKGRRAEKGSGYGRGRGKRKGMLKMGHCEKNTLGAIIKLPLPKPHNEMVQWNH